MRRNVAGQVVTAHLINRTDGTDVTTGSVSVFVTGDGGTQTSGAGAITHEGNGDWSYVPTQAETNFTQVAFTFVHSSAITTKEERYPVDYDSAGRVTANSVTGSVASVTSPVTAGTVSDKTGYLLASTQAFNLTGNITGNLSGSVGSVSGNVSGSVGSVVGNVGGNVVGSVASVTNRVTANTDQLAGQTVTAAAGVTFPTAVASPTNITSATGVQLAANQDVRNVTGSVTGSVGSVTGNVGGNVVGSVASVTAGVTLATTQPNYAPAKAGDAMALTRESAQRWPA